MDLEGNARVILEGFLERRNEKEGVLGRRKRNIWRITDGSVSGSYPDFLV